MLAAWLYKRYQAGLQDAANNVEIGQMMYSERMPKQVVALLAPFRVGAAAMTLDAAIGGVRAAVGTMTGLTRVSTMTRRPVCRSSPARSSWPAAAK